MISESGRSKRSARSSSSFSATREVAGVEEAGLRVDARLLLQLRDAERAVDQQQRSDRERDQPGVGAPERRHRDAEHGEHEVGREAREREEPRLADRVAARKVQHRSQQHVVDRHDRGGRREAGDGVVEVAAAEALEAVEGRVGRQHRERPVADVEDLDVPGATALQPLRDVHRDADQHDELGREQHRGRDQEDDRRVVRLVPRRAHDEELRDGRDRAEDDERRPPRRVRAQPREQRQRDGRGDRGDDEEVDRRLGRELRRVGAARLDVMGDRARDRAHALPPDRVLLGSKLVIGPLTVS